MKILINNQIIIMSKDNKIQQKQYQKILILMNLSQLFYQKMFLKIFRNNLQSKYQIQFKQSLIKNQDLKSFFYLQYIQLQLFRINNQNFQIFMVSLFSIFYQTIVNKCMVVDQDKSQKFLVLLKKNTQCIQINKYQFKYSIQI
ncbi:hypothetical protein IMG5_160850 [Ichthyophthirius multifiliis]|uniref:Uncharacterized protein n=1 Tax=Ichthyophthirius multifiliis TaxID=5932 RepID=G0QZZ6_ICHMU|nr:hypothetical protein IMG5_160850 [Ichthyophthirius multifiliis]EGR29206.1 hypothetical protein IMG5_160850 [Ichthyophthirius multifiliis]|eukprot:XP_004030442.1 hypothetical protein IMG5_160850 [Ichthyophthirius multifiliis]